MPEDLNDFFDDDPQWIPQSNGNSQLAPQPPKPPKSRSEMRRRRHNRKRKTIITIVVVLVVLALIAVGGYFGYVKLKTWSENRSNDSSQIADYPGPGSGEVQFSVASGEGATQIAKHLAAQDIVKSAEAFTGVVAANSSTLYPGTYTLRKQMAAADVLKILSDQSKASGFLEVKPGEQTSDVVKAAAQLSGIDVSQFTAVVEGGGSGILPTEANGSFEGWLEPGSYDISNQKSASDIMKTLVDARVSQLDELGAPTGSERENLLIMASIAQSEVNSDAYYGKVVRVILNRIAANMPLGMDTTVAYGLGTTADQLTDAMLADSSNAYNTRIHTGLPPSPISNPSDQVITAAMNPPDGDWLYFVTTNLKTGETKFATTDEEFEKIRDEYKSSNANAN